MKNITEPLPAKRTQHVNTNPTEWSNIAYYPTNEERKEMLGMIHPQPPPRANANVQKKNVRFVAANVTMPSPPNATHVVGARHVTAQTRPMSRQPQPTTFKQLKAQNTHMFPPKAMRNAGGASALNKINLRYRMTSL